MASAEKKVDEASPPHAAEAASSSVESSITKLGLTTRAIHAGSRPVEWAHRPLMPPIYLTTTFKVEEPGEAQFDYSRCNNPTRTSLERYFASLESGAKQALAFSSGLGALTTLSFLLESGQHILSCDDVYGGTFRLFTRCLSQMGIETTYVDGSKLDNWTNNFRPGSTRLVWIETPSNPTMKLVDIQAVAQAIKRLDPECLVAVDNTFITSVFQAPLMLGADLVMHSCSKYMSGHSDILMGALMVGGSGNLQLFERLKFLQSTLGIVPSPFDCSLMIRSLKTLEVRVRAQSETAMKVAEYLESQSKYVERVLYPGLKSHPQHELAARQATGFGAMLSIYLKKSPDNIGQEPCRFMRALKIFTPAESLGCVSSLVQIPALMTHRTVPAETRARVGITDNMLRVSVGLENFEDLVDDLRQAFEAVYSCNGQI